MGKWPMVRLGDVATVVSGSTPKTSVEEYWNGNNCWVTPAELSDDVVVINDTIRKITDLAVKDTGLKPLSIGTVLLSSRAPIGKVAITGRVMYCNQGFKNLVCGERIYNKYLLWFLKGKTEYLNSLGRGATFKEISKEIVEGINIPLPPLNIQKYIANTLDKTQEIIDGHKKQLAELDYLIKVVFYEMFGDPVLNEKGWDVKPLQKCAEIVSGVTKGRDLTGKEVVNVPYLRVANVQDGYIDISDIKTIDVLPEDKVKYKLQRGDILLTEGGDPDKLGRGSVWYEEIPDCIHQNHIFRVRVDKDILNPEYVSKLIGSDYGKRYFLKSAKQTTGIATINSKQLKEFLVLCPPLDLQTKFANIVTKIEEQKALVKQAIAESEHLFKSLMSEYFD